MTRTLTARPQSRRALTLYPALTSGWQRDTFIHLVERVAPHLGVGRAAAHTWARLAAMTRPTDWTAEDREPFVYAAASELAKILALSETRLRAHTARLERAGLLERRTAANGSRSRHAGTGLFFSAVIDRFPELLALDAQLTAARRKAIYLRGQRSTHWRCLRQALEHLREVASQDARVQAIEVAFAAWPRADRLHGMTLDTLAAHEMEADALTRDALDLLEMFTKTGDRPPENERSHLQDTNEDCSLSCEALAGDRRPAAEPAFAQLSRLPPESRRADAENERGSGTNAVRREWLTKLGPERLFRLASPEMQFYLSGRADPERLRFHDFIWTAEWRVLDLGIHHSAWSDACTAMGEDGATVAMLILDARKDDPVAPIISPGGYLRGMTRAWLQGHLNLMGSLIGLSERRRREQML
ncbi:replication initiation protein RepC [Paracoccus actinidiae]|uniref:replication initiation protein RepC n=1 Tax=Paracoccus actinidiae TaxID=3064531 RepID=UPI0027D2E4A2|nr:replication initiation protein RepC [Paracoccus sp. M09]